MPFKIYKDDEVVVEGESPLTITGLEPNTDVAEGEYKAVRVEGDRESEKVDIPAFKTLPIEVTSVEVSPKTNNLEVNDTRQLNVTVEPSNATNKKVTYESDDDAVASVDSEGLVTAVSEGTATISVKTDDGDHEDTATVNVTEPEPEPEEPEEGE